MFTRVFADGPAALGEITLAGFDRRAFKLRRHRVVEAVEKAEQRDHRDDIDNLCLAVVLLQLYEIRVYHRAGDLYGTLRDPERGALGGGEERARLEFPKRIFLVRSNADAIRPCARCAPCNSRNRRRGSPSARPNSEAVDRSSSSAR